MAFVTDCDNSMTQFLPSKGGAFHSFSECFFAAPIVATLVGPLLGHSGATRQVGQWRSKARGAPQPLKSYETDHSSSIVCIVYSCLLVCACMHMHIFSETISHVDTHTHTCVCG